TCCLDILPVQAFSVQNPIDPVFKVQCRLRAFSQVGTIHYSKAVLERRGFRPKIFDEAMIRLLFPTIAQLYENLVRVMLG
ncbi:MAG: hypothetical protein VKK42_25155, partial [Lyngbya sp.]|nr:hypothetical protein [Lyngbya sp.]